MLVFVAAGLAVWLLAGYLTADFLADLSGDARLGVATAVTGLALWPVLAPLLTYIWWTCE